MKPTVEESSTTAASIFVKHGMEVNVGVAMLHKHFPLSADEILVEQPCDDKSFVRPVNLSETDVSKLLPYMFKVRETSSGFVLVPLEFAPMELVDNATLVSLANNTAFINEFGKLIKDNGALNVVGLTVLHRDHIARVDGSTVEFTDHGSRELLIVPSSKALDHEAKVGKHSFTTKTVWTFGSREGEDVCHHCVHCSHTK